MNRTLTKDIIKSVVDIKPGDLCFKIFPSGRKVLGQAVEVKSRVKYPWYKGHNFNGFKALESYVDPSIENGVQVGLVFFAHKTGISIPRSEYLYFKYELVRPGSFQDMIYRFGFEKILNTKLELI